MAEKRKNGGFDIRMWRICKGDTTKHRDITLTGFENLLGLGYFADYRHNPTHNFRLFFLLIRHFFLKNAFYIKNILIFAAYIDADRGYNRLNS
jgi:hypothetical protein